MRSQEFGKTKAISQFVVRDVAYDASLGAEALESILADHFALEFNEKVLKQKGDVRATPKSMAKLRKQCKKTKEVLSANSESYFSVEELYQEHDFKSTVSRETFEGLLEERMSISDRVKQPVMDLLARNRLTPKDLDFFELVGGGSRIPIVQRALQEVLGDKPLDRHLDADEATVLGAGLIAANMSTSFRLRQFGMADGVPFGIKMVRGDLEGPNATVTVLPRMKHLPQARKVTLSIPNAETGPADTLDFTLAYDDTVDLPPAVEDATIGRFQLSGLADVFRRYNTTGKVALHLLFDNGGMVTPTRAEATIEATEMVEVEEKVPLDPEELEALRKQQAEAAATEAASAAAAEAAADGNEEVAEGEFVPEAPAEAPTANATAAAPPNVTETFKVVKVLKPKKRIYRVNLPIGGPGYVLKGMSADRFTAARANLARLQEAERVKADNARAKNDLEAFVISALDALQEDADYIAASTEKDRQALLKDMTDAEEWLYGDGEHATAEESRKKLASIKAPFEKIATRVREARERPGAVAEARRAIDAVIAGAKAWSESKPWIGMSESDKLEKEANGIVSWLEKQEKAQAKKKPTEDPAWLVSELTGKVRMLEFKFKAADLIKKPKEKKEEKKKDGEGAKEKEAKAQEEGESAEGKSKDTGEGEGKASSAEQDDVKDEL